MKQPEMTFTAAIRAHTLFVLGSLGLLLLLAGCAGRTPSPENKSNSNASALSTLGHELPGTAASTDIADTQGYVGNAACADCHQKEFKDHGDSNHAHALHLMTPDDLGTSAPPPGPLTNTPTMLKLADKAYSVDTDPPRGRGLPLQYAFGAGKFCFTFVGVLPDSKSFELRASYVPKTRKWQKTPGQEFLGLSSFGIRHNTQVSRKCFGCHVITLSPTGLTPEKRFMGVGCKSCHGPGNAHITAMRSGQAVTSATDLHIDRPANWGAKRQNEMCGRCHRTGADVNTKQPDTAVTARFQPYGLMLSRCFKESNDTLSCSTCHNPHQNTSHDIRAYEAACLNCHRGNREEKEKRRKGEKEKGNSQSAIGNQQSAMPSSFILHPSSFAKACPVNPQSRMYRLPHAQT